MLDVDRSGSITHQKLQDSVMEGFHYGKAMAVQGGSPEVATVLRRVSEALRGHRVGARKLHTSSLSMRFLT